MHLQEALIIAERTRAELAPHCYRCEIAGSVRRRKADPGDIEMVAIPRSYDVGLFESGIATVVNRWPKIRGELGPECRYTCRMLPQGIKLDLFFASRENWGLIFAIRTGSSRFSHEVLAKAWVRAGYKSIGGMLHRGTVPVPVREERELFNLIGVPWIEPEKRV